MKKYIQIVKLTIASFCLLFSFTDSLAQDATFSQYYSSPMTLNPALIGNQSSTTVGINYRHGITNNIVRSQRQVAFMMPLRSESGGFYDRHIGGVGLSVFNGQSGEDGNFMVNSVKLGAAYNISYGMYGTNMVTFGLQGGITQKSFDRQNIFLGGDYNGTTGEIISNPDVKIDDVIYPVLEAGVMWNHAVKLNKNFIAKVFYLGFSASSLNLPNEASDSDANDQIVPLLLKLHGGYVYNTTSEDWQISPNFLVQYQDGLYEANVGMYLSYLMAGEETQFGDESHRLTFGAWYKVLNSFVYNLGYENSLLQLGFSYDMNTRYLEHNLGINSAFEISAKYRFNNKNKKKLFFSPLL